MKKQGTYLLIFFIALIGIIFIASKYRYNHCVRINNEELARCQQGDLGNYDCTVFENAEELCTL